MISDLVLHINIHFETEFAQENGIFVHWIAAKQAVTQKCFTKSDSCDVW